jgi:hypothetical protein
MSPDLTGDDDHGTQGNTHTQVFEEEYDARNI